MDLTKKELKSRYNKAIRRLARESDIIDRARDRKIYWQSIAKNLEIKLDLVNEGQQSFQFNQGEVNESAATSVSNSKN